MYIVAGQQASLMEAAELLDEAVIVANEIGESGIFTEPEEMDPDLLARSLELSRSAQKLKGLSVVYSGLGFVPIEDCCGEMVTAYSDVNCAQGRLNAIYLTDGTDLDYTMPDEIEFEDDEAAAENPEHLESHDVEAYAFRERLREAQSGLRLFVEFVVQNEVEVDQPVRGHAVRSSEYTLYNIMDAASLNVVYVDEPEEDPLVESFEVNEALWRLSTHYRKQIQNKRFRNLSIEKQREQIDTFLERANQALQLDRFGVMFNAKDGAAVFVPDADEESGFEYCETVKGFTADALRLDCIESAILATGKPIRRRKGNYNSLVSTCVVVEIDDATRDRLQVGTNIVWLPIMNQHDHMDFLEAATF